MHKLPYRLLACVYYSYRKYLSLRWLRLVVCVDQMSASLCIKQIKQWSVPLWSSFDFVFFLFYSFFHFVKRIRIEHMYLCMLNVLVRPWHWEHGRLNTYFAQTKKKHMRLCIAAIVKYRQRAMTMIQVFVYYYYYYDYYFIWTRSITMPFYSN